jgi:hypothetical protein
MNKSGGDGCSSRTARAAAKGLAAHKVVSRSPRGLFPIWS